MLRKVKTWITVHWWAMLLISFASVASMIIFMRLCSYRTPSSRAYYLRGVPLGHPLPPRVPPSRPPERPRPSAVGYQGLPREHFVPSFRLKRQRVIDPVNGVERHVSELIPASSVPVPYHRNRGVNRTQANQRSHPKPRPVSVVVYPQPVLPSHVRELRSQGPRDPPHQRPPPARRGNKSHRPVSFIVVSTSAGENDVPDDLPPPEHGSPPPVYSPRSKPPNITE
uniref:Uncharacterized protein n=1 Tax=Mesocestoides corti TaxID=53468 RepID=A0A5K3FY51_MESCO